VEIEYVHVTAAFGRYRLNRFPQLALLEIFRDRMWNLDVDIAPAAIEVAIYPTPTRSQRRSITDDCDDLARLHSPDFTQLLEDVAQPEGAGRFVAVNAPEADQGVARGIAAHPTNDSVRRCQVCRARRRSSHVLKPLAVFQLGVGGQWA